MTGTPFTEIASSHAALVLGLVLALALIVSAVLVAILRPLLIRHVMAAPNARSSHKVATPQGGGVAVVAATVLAVACGYFLLPETATSAPIVVFVAVIVLAVVGMIDDMRPLGALPRLILQALAVAAIIAVLPNDMRALPVVPLWLERALMLIAGIWFVNLVNFMDGIDWMTAAEVVPVTIGLAIAGALGAIPAEATVAAVALLGAMLGFAPFNRPIARIFLGDVGSLPIGLLLFWLLALLAGAGHLAAALLLPLYYLADATITLIRRTLAGEKITQAHRSHFYQRALHGGGGLTVMRIVVRIMAVNVVLIALAVTTLLHPSPAIHALALVAGCVVVGWLLYRFERNT